MGPQADRLICTAGFSDHLTVGKAYRLIAYRADRDRARVQNDHGRTIATSPALVSFTLDDPIADPYHDCIEVTVRLASGERRWCLFATPAWLIATLNGEALHKVVTKGGLTMTQINPPGDTRTAADGTRFGTLAVPHLIVVTVLSAAVVEEALRDLVGGKRLLHSTLPLGSPGEASNLDEEIHG